MSKPDTPARTVAVRRLIHALVGAYAGAWIGDGIIVLAKLTGPAAGLVAVLVALLGAAAGWLTSRDIAPWSDQDVRDGAIGWGIVAAVVLVVSSTALPMPWPPITAVLAVIAVCVTVTTIRRAVGAADNA